MTRLKTNATNLPELDIALEELCATGNLDESLPAYQRSGRCSATFANFDRAIARLAMFDYLYSPSAPEPDFSIPTLWCKIRGHRYDKRFDHSTHSLYPFQGKIEPRLARACINIGIGSIEHAKIVDPFCGSGTVLLEANLMGLEAIGGDIDPFAVWLSETKLTTYIKLFQERIADLWRDDDSAPPIELQRHHCPPTNTPATVTEQNAIALLASCHDVDAVVTSPPYFDAIDYNDRHRIMRRQLGLGPPGQDGLGVVESVQEYDHKIDDVCNAISNCLRPGGRAVIIAAPYRGVDTPMMFEDGLRVAGLGPITRLARPYREPVLGVVEDVITVMEKP